MLRILFVIWVLLPVAGAAAQDQWTRFEFLDQRDDFTDERRVLVGSVTNTRVLPPAVFLICAAGGEGVALQGDEFLSSMQQNVRVRYRFDDGVTHETFAPPIESLKVYLYDDATAQNFREGLLTGSRLRFQLGNGRVHDVPLSGSTAAMQQYIDACAEMR